MSTGVTGVKIAIDDGEFQYLKNIELGDEVYYDLTISEDAEVIDTADCIDYLRALKENEPDKKFVIRT